MEQYFSEREDLHKKRLSLDKILARRILMGRDSDGPALAVASALRKITVYDYYDEFFRKRYQIKGTEQDSEVRGAHQWLSDVIEAMLGETDTKKLTMRELADRISAAVESPGLRIEERMNYYVLCHILTDEMRPTDCAMLPGLDRTDEMNRYDAAEDAFGSDLFSRAAEVRNRRLFLGATGRRKEAANIRRSLDEILEEAGYGYSCSALRNMIRWSANMGLFAWITARYFKRSINYDDWIICREEAQEFVKIAELYSDLEWREEIPFIQFAGQISDELIITKLEDGLSVRTMEHYELCYQFIMLMAGKTLKDKHISLMRARGTENYMDYYEREEAEKEAILAVLEDDGLENVLYYH